MGKLFQLLFAALYDVFVGTSKKIEESQNVVVAKVEETARTSNESLSILTNELKAVATASKEDAKTVIYGVSQNVGGLLSELEKNTSQSNAQLQQSVENTLKETQNTVSSLREYIDQKFNEYFEREAQLGVEAAEKYRINA